MKTLLLSIILVASACALCVILCSSAGCDIPKAITFQGRLTDYMGKPVADGYYGIRFRIYDVETGGSPLWERIRMRPTAVS